MSKKTTKYEEEMKKLVNELNSKEQKILRRIIAGEKLVITNDNGAICKAVMKKGRQSEEIHVLLVVKLLSDEIIFKSKSITTYGFVHPEIERQLNKK